MLFCRTERQIIDGCSVCRVSAGVVFQASPGHVFTAAALSAGPQYVTRFPQQVRRVGGCRGVVAVTTVSDTAVYAGLTDSGVTT